MQLCNNGPEIMDCRYLKINTSSMTFYYSGHTVEKKGDADSKLEILSKNIQIMQRRKFKNISKLINHYFVVTRGVGV